MRYASPEILVNSARKFFVSGYSSTSFTDRLGCMVRQRCPRPEVSPKTIQFAAK